MAIFSEPCDGPEHDGPSPYDHECRCLAPDDSSYTLEIDCGSVSVVHKACGKQFRSAWDEFLTMAPIPVAVTWRSDEPDYWTGGSDSWAEITITPGSEELATPDAADQ
jgi:hypothetical protein